MSTSNDFQLDDGVGDEMGDSPGRLCQGSNAKKQVGVQLPTSADNVALLAVAAARGAAVADRRPTGRAAIDQYISWPPGSAAANAQQRRRRPDCGTDGQTNRRTDGRTDARQLHRPCST